eukprot:350136-Chlamydomonas_euryale.AAC.13
MKAGITCAMPALSRPLKCTPQPHAFQAWPHAFQAWPHPCQAWPDGDACSSHALQRRKALSPQWQSYEEWAGCFVHTRAVAKL